MAKKKIVFLTGTRADFGKLKPLIHKVEHSDRFECYVFVTGMHTLSKYGSTCEEVKRQNYSRVYIYMNQANMTPMDIILANTIIGFSNFVKEIKPDMIVVHGDRVEALAGAIVGSLNNVLVAHIEGGEVSGTIDELIRHSTTKLSHVHFVANGEAKRRLVQMGENEENIYAIGSPDIDIMYSSTLPSLEETKSHYNIGFENYSIFVYHPVTTEIGSLEHDVRECISALIESNRNYIIIYPNNDLGSDIILREFERLKGDVHFNIFPSIRFESFLTLFKNADFIIGNSSMGPRVSEIYGIPSVNIGNRQHNRSRSKNIINVDNNKREILQAIDQSLKLRIEPVSNFGDGNSSDRFCDIITASDIWNTNIQKRFFDQGGLGSFGSDGKEAFLWTIPRSDINGVEVD